MLKFFQEKIQKPTDELVRLAEENRRLWENHDCHLSPEDSCEACDEMWEDWGNREWEDKKINATQ